MHVTASHLQHEVVTLLAQGFLPIFRRHSATPCRCHLKVQRRWRQLSQWSIRESTTQFPCPMVGGTIVRLVLHCSSEGCQPQLPIAVTSHQHTLYSPVSLPRLHSLHPLSPVPWDQLPNKVPTLELLSQPLLSKNPRPRSVAFPNPLPLHLSLGWGLLPRVINHHQQPHLRLLLNPPSVLGQLSLYQQ